ncbi:hypothetical protein GF373_17480 [bacterium]|nr:hypothetical protein [bacterium]
MPITLIDKIAPKADAFTGMVDAEQVIGDGATNVLPNNTISASGVLQHESAIDHLNIQNVGTYSHSDIDSHIDNVGLHAFASTNITLSVSTTGDDDDESRPEIIPSGDWSSYPFATIQGAVDSLPSVVAPYQVVINVGSGNFTGAEIRGRRGNIRIKGTSGVVTPTSGLATGTATSAGERTLTVTGAGWTADDFEGKFIEITDGTGAGQKRCITGNTTDTLTTAAKWTTSLDATSEFSIYEPKTVINTGVLNSFGIWTGITVSNTHGDIDIEDLSVQLSGAYIFALGALYSDRVTFQDCYTSGCYYTVFAQDCYWISTQRVIVESSLTHPIYAVRVVDQFGFGGEVFINGGGDDVIIDNCELLLFDGYYVKNLPGDEWGTLIYRSRGAIVNGVWEGGSRGITVHTASSIILEGAEFNNITHRAVYVTNCSNALFQIGLSSTGNSGLGYKIETTSSVMGLYLDNLTSSGNDLEIDGETFSDITQYLAAEGDSIRGPYGSVIARIQNDEG